MTGPSLPLILASGSPRRRDLLSRAGVRLEVRPPDVPEETRDGESPEDLVDRLAGEKALAVARRVGAEPRRWVLGADTIVVLGRSILGKPTDARHAEELLGSLVGRAHRVITGVALVASDTLEMRRVRVESRVTMRPATADEIAPYVAGGEPLDKAGAYAAQGEGRRFIDRIAGSETNVIGLPMDETLALLREVGAGP